MTNNQIIITKQCACSSQQSR